jgi:hypothetical protein
MHEMHLLAVKAADTEASAILKLAQAEAQELGTQMQLYMSQFQGMMQQFEGMMNGQGNVSGMGQQPINPEVPPVPPGLPAESDGGLGGSGLQPQDSGDNGAAQFADAGQGGDVAGAVQPG